MNKNEEEIELLYDQLEKIRANLLKISEPMSSKYGPHKNFQPQRNISTREIQEDMAQIQINIAELEIQILKLEKEIISKHQLRSILDARIDDEQINFENSIEYNKTKKEEFSMH